MGLNRLKQAARAMALIAVCTLTMTSQAAIQGFESQKLQQEQPSQRLGRGSILFLRRSLDRDAESGDRFEMWNGAPVSLAQIQAGEVASFYFFPAKNKHIKIFYSFFERPQKVLISVRDISGRRLASETILLNGTMKGHTIEALLNSLDEKVAMALRSRNLQVESSTNPFG